MVSNFAGVSQEELSRMEDAFLEALNWDLSPNGDLPEFESEDSSTEDSVNSVPSVEFCDKFDSEISSELSIYFA